MSYILDALKKSDQERKQGDVPDLQTIHLPAAMESESTRWPYMVILFLMLSLAFVLGTLRPWESESVVQLSRQTNEIVKAQPQASVPLPVEKNKKPVQKAAENIPQKNHSAQQINQPVIVKQPVVNKAPSLDIDSVLHLSEMPSLVQQAIPEMIFAGHVFSSNVEQRSVIINNHYMNEGDVIIGGLKIEQITQSGIVFNYNGQLFRMDVLQDWSFD